MRRRPPVRRRRRRRRTGKPSPRATENEGPSSVRSEVRDIRSPGMAASLLILSFILERQTIIDLAVFFFEPQGLVQANSSKVLLKYMKIEEAKILLAGKGYQRLHQTARNAMSTVVRVNHYPPDISYLRRRLRSRRQHQFSLTNSYSLNLSQKNQVALVHTGVKRAKILLEITMDIPQWRSTNAI